MALSITKQLKVTQLATIADVIELGRFFERNFTIAQRKIPVLIRVVNKGEYCFYNVKIIDEINFDLTGRVINISLSD